MELHLILTTLANPCMTDTAAANVKMHVGLEISNDHDGITLIHRHSLLYRQQGDDTYTRDSSFYNNLWIK